VGADAALVAETGELILSGGTRDGLPLSDLWSVDPRSGRARQIAADVPGARPVEVGFVLTGGLALAVHIHGDRLFVATWGGAVGIYGLSVPTEPAYLGEIDAGAPVVAIRAQGTTVHLQRLAPGGGWALACLLGLECRPGDTVEVFDVRDPLVPTQVGEYAASDSLPWITARLVGAHLVVPEARGLKVLGVEPVEAAP